MRRKDDSHLIDTRHLARRFDRAAASFDDSDFVHTVTRDNLLDRLQPVVVEAGNVVDLGAASGKATRALAKRFRGAHVVSLDISQNMLMASLAKRRWMARHSAVRSDARALPFRDGSIDVVFSNLLLPWIDDPGAVFAEVSRVLRDGGLFAFATLGPDSLLVLRNAWQSVDDGAHVNQFPDMHDVGDALVRAGLADPVLDVDRLTVSYSSAVALFRDLTAVGARNALAARPDGLCGRRRFAEMRNNLEKGAGGEQIEVQLELVYGHCWGTGRSLRDGEYRVDAGQIPLRRGQTI